ncbi:MAG TPA: hypothetical protein VJN21_04315 [Candidatus Acidoferrales bacterium]|nr:hypothetical protein [Candidatus Acidoferrales bacterium]
MRDQLRCALALLLAVCLAALPVMAAPNRAMGYVLQAQAAQLDGNSAINGTNVYAGDVVETEIGGSLRLQIAASQIYLFGSTAATLNEDQSGVATMLTSGTAGFSAAPGGAVSICALDVTVRPKAAEVTHAQVTVAGPQELLVTSFRGALELDLGGKSYSVAPGRTYKVDVQSADRSQMDAGRHVARKQGGLIIVVFAGVPALGAGLFIYHELHESPEKP